MLLFAAYSVAVSASDSEYFAEICRDLAQSLQSESGRAACEAQDEVLQVCDQLYLANKLTENQLLYLRHLVLIREEAVASVYDDFQEHQSVPQLAKALYELANTHPYQSIQESREAKAGGIGAGSGAGSGAGAGRSFGGGDKDNKLSGRDEDEEDEDDDDEEEDEEMKAARRSSRLRHLNGLLASLMGEGKVSVAEATILLELLKGGNEYVSASYELFEADGDEAELADTLMRCAKLEIRKRAAALREAQLEAEQEQSKRRAKLLQDAKYKYDEAFNEHGEVEDEDEEEEDADFAEMDYEVWKRQRERALKATQAAAAATASASRRVGCLGAVMSVHLYLYILDMRVHTASSFFSERYTPFSVAIIQYHNDYRFASACI
jgi:hypothetical protein